MSRTSPRTSPGSSPRTFPARMRELVVSERAELDRLLDEVVIGHVGLTVGTGDLGHGERGRGERGRGEVAVIPTALARDADSILVHGSTGSGWMRLVADGRPACVTVTALDGIVVARSAFESSFRYRSAVLFGTFTPVPDHAKERALQIITERMLAGRSGEIRAPLPRELAATLVLEMPIAEWSMKVSAGWPDDSAEDVAGDAWAGVIPLSQPRPGVPQPAPGLRPGIPVPHSVRAAAGSPHGDSAGLTHGEARSRASARFQDGQAMNSYYSVDSRH